MPVTIETEECKMHYEKMSPKLTHLLERRNIPLEVIGAIGRDDVTTIGIFARTGRGNEDRFVEWLERDIGVKETDAGGRSLQARLLDAWDAAKTQKAEVDQAEAKARAVGMTPELLHADQIELRKSYQSVVGVLEDENYPSYSYINMRLEELEEGELASDTLDMVTSRALEKRNGNKDYAMEWTKTGEAIMKKHKLRGALPTTSEEYRSLYQLRRHQWGVVRIRHGQKAYLANINADFWFDHVEFMLGEKVRGLVARSPTGEVGASISWAAFLAFDQAVMDHAFKAVNMKGTPLAEAITTARTDNELRTQHLVTQLAISTTRSTPAPQPAQRAERDPQRGGWKAGAEKGGGGGKSGGKTKGKRGAAAGKPQAKVKGKGKGSTKLNLARRNNLVKVGQEGACFAYNKPEGCPRGEACEYKHVCVYCEGPHSVETCHAFARWLNE